MYKIETPNKLYSGVTEGVPFSNGIGTTGDKNTRNVLVNDYGYKDITEYSASKDIVVEQDGIDIEELTVDQLKELAKDLNLKNYSKLKRDELIGLIEKTAEENDA